ncbi:hypothetical protein KAT08_03750 [Candidatus Babeliales bacterium]|nr:hypothetical protein [Candidatus Babeliales bacterium]
MKNFFSIFLIFIFSIFYSLFSSQPPEYGLIFGSNNKKNVVARYLKGRKKQSFSIDISNMREKKMDKSESEVFKVKNLPEFLYLYSKNLKPIIIKIFYGNDAFKNEFHDLADQMKNKAFFISIDANNNPPLVQLFTLILTSKGISFPNGLERFPMFLFCNSGFIEIQKRGILNFKKESLELLISPGPGSFKKNEIIIAINKKVEKQDNYGIKALQEENSLWQRLRKWLGSRFKIKNP